MDDDNNKDNNKTNNTDDELTVDEHSDYKPADRFDASAVHHLSGMYKNWFLDYASYVILERAVPHIEDGLKPVQRRILHSMKQMDDGRYNKVANIVGHTMQYHPHGDASIGDALVQMGQKDLLIDTQGNWGNILTGDSAAAPRYIEARLSKFALDTVFNPKTTEWQLSYDGRNKEPITLPVKFPLLLAQGANGIAVGLSSRILPHNLNEICEAAIKYLKGEEFHLYPDFPTGGSIDVSKYNDGQRGGTLKVRAKIEKLDNKTLVIREIPFTKTASSLQESITKAVEKGKLKIRKVEDMTAREVEIQLHLAPGVSSDKTIDALYAFTDCEINIAPNCCVIEDNKPQFLTVSDVLRHSVDRTKGLLKRELEIRKGELEEQLFYASLEQIFIEERIYKGKPFENAKNTDELCEYIDERLTPFYPQFIREVRKEDILRLLEIKMQRIAKFNKDKNEELIARIKDEIAGIEKDLSEMTRVTIEWFEFLQKKYGKDHPRKTEIKSFDTIIAAKVAEKNEKLYVDRKEGFIGYGLKKAEFVQNCSDLDDVVVFYKDGKYKVIKITLNPNPKKKKQNIFLDKDFSEIKIKGREAKGNLLTREGIHRISLKSHGHSTLGGRKVWFDPDVLRINFDSHGDFLGEFNDGDLILVVLKNGEYYFTNFDPNNHYDGDILRIEKFDSKKVWTAVVIDADNQNYPYLKRFYMEESKKKQSFVGENPDSKLVLLTDDVYPRIDVVYGGADSARGHEEIDCEQFVGVKGFKAKGKRITTYNVDHIDELEPTRFPEEPEETPKNPSTDDDNDGSDGETENLDPDAGKSQQQVIDEITGQLELFPDDDSE